MRSTLMNIAVLLAMTLFAAPCFADKAPVQKSAAAPASYTVPEKGTPAEYLAFIKKITSVERPQNQTRKEAVEYFTKLCKAQITAADKVIEHKDANSEQIRQAASIKAKSLQILVKLGSKKAKALLDAMPAELKKANQPKIADDISMGLINQKFLDAQKTKDFSEIEKIVAQTTEAIKKTPADNKNKLQRLYRIKLICLKELGKLKGVDNSAAFDAVVAEVKAAGMTEVVEDVVLSKLVNSLSDSIARNDKALFDKTARSVDSTISSYGAKANSKVAAVAFRTAYTEETFNPATAAARYTNYANYFSRIRDAKVQEIVKKMRGAAKRLSLKGKPLPITGKTIDGKQFNMANLKNKNVLVVPWSSSDPDSIQKLNYLRRAYPAYKAKGFEVVGVAMDRNPQRAIAMARQYNFPWTNMSYRDAYVGSVPFWIDYGLGHLSRMIMLNRYGYVSSANLNYRSLVNELDREYGRLTKAQIDAFKDIDYDKFLDRYNEYEFDKYLDGYDYDYLNDNYDYLNDSYDDDFDNFDDINDLDYIDDIDAFDDGDAIDDINDIDTLDDIDDIDTVDGVDDIDNFDDIDDIDSDIENIDDINDIDSVDDINGVDDVDGIDDITDGNDAIDNIDDIGDVNDGVDDIGDAVDDGGYDDGGVVDDGGYDDGGAVDDGGYDDGGAVDDGGYDDGGAVDDGGYDDGGYDDGGYDDGGYDDF